MSAWKGEAACSKAARRAARPRTLQGSWWGAPQAVEPSGGSRMPEVYCQLKVVHTPLTPTCIVQAGMVGAPPEL